MIQGWGNIFKKATEEQLLRRGEEGILLADGINQEGYTLMEMKSILWITRGSSGMMIGTKMNRGEEAIAARLQEVKQLHNHDVYE